MSEEVHIVGVQGKSVKLNSVKVELNFAKVELVDFPCTSATWIKIITDARGCHVGYLYTSY